jgi:TRAP transporter TAXI family solute receptor
MLGRWNAAGLAVAIGLGALSLTSTPSAADQIRLMTGPQGGSWYPLGGAIKNAVEGSMDTGVQVAPGGGIANVKAVQSGKAEMGFANSVSTVDAIKGKPPFDSPADNVCNIATLYPQYFQVVVLGDAGLSSPADFKGNSLAAQKKGNTGEAITEHMLKAYGLTYDDMSRVNYGSYTDSVNLMKDGNAQIFTLGTTVPAGAIMDLAAARDVTLVDIDDDGLKRMQEINPGYKRIMIPAGSYPGQDKDVATIGYFTHVVAQCSLPEDTVYNVLKAMVANVDDMAAIAKAMQNASLEGMASDIGVPLHPGAIKFYKEQGVM